MEKFKERPDVCEVSHGHARFCNPHSVPEPSTFNLLFIGTILVVAFLRRKFMHKLTLKLIKLYQSNLFETFILPVILFLSIAIIVI